MAKEANTIEELLHFEKFSPERKPVSPLLKKILKRVEKKPASK